MGSLRSASCDSGCQAKRPVKGINWSLIGDFPDETLGAHLDTLVLLQVYLRLAKGARAQELKGAVEARPLGDSC